MIVDGKLIENRSVPREKLEDEFYNRGETDAFVSALDNRIDLHNGRITFIENIGLEDKGLKVTVDELIEHMNTDIGDAHGGKLPASKFYTGNEGVITEAMFSPQLYADLIHKSGGNETIYGNKTFANNVIIQGKMTVTGTVTTISSTDMEIKDNEIVLNAGEEGAGVSTGYAGLRIDRGSGEDFLIRYFEQGNVLKIGTGSELYTVITNQSLTSALATLRDSEILPAIQAVENKMVAVHRAGVFAGASGFTTITLPKDMGNNYVVMITPEATQGVGSLSAIGEYGYQVLTSTTFKVINTGQQGYYFSYIAMKVG